MATFILDAAEDQCRFPLWDDDETIGDVCGAKVVGGGVPYCAACARIAYTPFSQRAPSAPREHVLRSPVDREPDLVEVFK